MRCDGRSRSCWALAALLAATIAGAKVMAQAPPSDGASDGGAEVQGPPARSPDLTPTPPPGAGPEYTSYGALPSVRNRFLVGGLLGWLGVLVGGLLMLDGRRMAAAVVGGVAVAGGVALMLSEML